MVPAILFDTLLALTVIVAFWRGRWEERMVASIVLMAVLLTVFTSGALASRYHLGNWRLIAIDGGAFLSTTVAAVLSKRRWPLWAAAWQLATLLANFAPMAQRRAYPLPYAIAEQIWAWLILILVLAIALRRPVSRPARAP